MNVIVTPVPPEVEELPDVPDVPIYRLSVTQYHQMIQAGILTEDDPVELLEGWLVLKMGKNPPHTVITGLIQDLLPPLLPAGWHLKMQDPVDTSDSEPEPDAAVIRGQRSDYWDRHPSPQDTALVVEVSDSTLRRDRTSKKRLYARAGIPVYWIVNLVEKHIEVYTEPSGPAKRPNYRQQKNYGRPDQIPVVLAGQEIGRLTVSALFR